MLVGGDDVAGLCGVVCGCGGMGMGMGMCVGTCGDVWGCMAMCRMWGLFRLFVCACVCMCLCFFLLHLQS